MKTVNINIKGQAGSGKSRLGLLFYKFLKENGFNVELIENDTDAMILESNFDSVIEHIRSNTKIVITSSLVSRSTPIISEP